MKLFKVKEYPVYDESGLCKKFITPCKSKHNCKLKKTLFYCMGNEDDIFDPKGYQNKYIVRVMRIEK